MLLDLLAEVMVLVHADYVSFQLGRVLLIVVADDHRLYLVTFLVQSMHAVKSTSAAIVVCETCNRLSLPLLTVVKQSQVHLHPLKVDNQVCLEEKMDEEKRRLEARRLLVLDRAVIVDVHSAVPRCLAMMPGCFEQMNLLRVHRSVKSWILQMPCGKDQVSRPSVPPIP